MATAIDIQNLPHTPQRDEGEFVVMEHVPFFKAHTNQNGDVIDRAALEKIAARCNKRITETGDRPPVVIAHTKDDQSNDPEVVGFAGPFYVGRLGNENPVDAIFGPMNIFREDYPRMKKYPRRSVEYWASKKDPTNGYFDPICLLGATTPELDLGLHYSKRGEGDEVIRYQKIDDSPIRYAATAMPGGNNTFIPSGTNCDKKDKESYEKESASMADTTDANAPLFSEAQLLQLVDAFKPVIQACVKEEIGAMKEPDEEDDDVPVDDDAVVKDDLEAEPEKNEKEDDDEPPPKEEEPTANGKEMPPKKDDYEENSKYEKANGDEQKTLYAKAIAERDELQLKYQKEVAARRDVEAERDQLKTLVAAETADKTTAIRYQKLTELNTLGYCFEVADEVKECAEMSDEQFTRHCERVVTKYQKIPTNRIPIPKSPVLTGTPNGDAEEMKRQRYSKQAMDNVLEAKNHGKSLDFKEELERLCKQAA